MTKAEVSLRESMKKESYVKDLYRRVLIDTSDDKYREENARIDNLLKLYFRVLITDYRCPFVTSDNPGFTIKNECEFYNLELGFVQQFAFPLSPKSLFLLDARIADNNLTLERNIHYQKVTPIQVNFYNMGTAFTANERIFSQLKDQLDIAKNLLIKNAA